MMSKKIIDFLSGGNRTHFHVLWVSLMVMILVPINQNFPYGNELVYAAAIVYAAFYISRLLVKSRHGFKVWNFIKSAANALIIFMFVLRLEESHFIAVIFFVLVYLIDRWLLKTIIKEWQLVLNIITILISMLFIVNAQVQNEKFREEAMKNEKLIDQVIEFKELAQKEAANAREAEAKAVILLKELEECHK